jgi:hypothetical protein
MTPPDDAAVGQTLDIVNFSAIGTAQGMGQIARPPAAARDHPPVALIRVAAIPDVVHASQTYYRHGTF